MNNEYEIVMIMNSIAQISFSNTPISSGMGLRSSTFSIAISPIDVSTHSKQDKLSLPSALLGALRRKNATKEHAAKLMSSETDLMSSYQLGWYKRVSLSRWLDIANNASAMTAICALSLKDLERNFDRNIKSSDWYCARPN